jgi:thioredoxin reductase (NADPH)
MLTTDEVRSIPLFATLPVAQLERLAETSADLHLAAGEFAIHEGGDRALYAVLAGKIQVVRLDDGIERTLDWRVPGTIFGEVPIAFGTVFVGGYRASEPSRVFRVDPKQYYATAANSPEVAVKVGALARERISGLQGIAAEAPKARVVMVGNRWDSASSALRQYDVVKAGRWSHGRDPYLLESSAPGIFACGDVRLSPVKRVAAAIGEGSMAIAFVHKYLQQDR